ncbi:MAG: 3D domain-containing protein [Cyclobacteriaceae bacterium]
MKFFIDRSLSFFIILSILFLASCAETKTMEVTATAYNSVENQTKKGDPITAAWGDQMKPGMKAIAVSRDLLNEEGLEYGTEVKIEGLPGEYTVLDKMNKRWNNKIDIYMGENVERAREWGKQEVMISWKAD